MNKLLTLFFIAVSTVVFSQNTPEYHKISLKDKNDKISGFNFYVENVYDGRQFKENIGTVQKGGFNRKVLANFENPLVDEFSDYLAIVCPKQDNKSKISIRINDLYVSELTREMSETGYATLVVDIIEPKDGIDYIVGTYTASAESNGMDVTNKHDERLKKVLQECLTNYMKISDNEKTSIVFDADQNIKSKTITAVPSKGIYLTYVDVLNNSPLDDSNFEISNKNERFHLLNKTTKLKELNYYGFSDGEVFYINVAKYADAKYYAKTEIIGSKYYIENVVYNPNNAVAMGAMFGLIGVAIASATSSSSVPMLIDCYSGQPSFLSNNEIKAMLMPYPVLSKDFKNSKKSSDDIKTIMKRYYQETIVQ